MERTSLHLEVMPKTMLIKGVCGYEAVVGWPLVAFIVFEVMESEHESESNDANNSRNEDEEHSPIISVKKKSDHDNEHRVDKDININEKASGSSEKSNSSHSASSSSESSSDFFQIDAQLPWISSTFPVVSPEAQEDSQSPEKREKNDIPDVDMSSESEDLGEKTPYDLSSQVSHATNESTLQTASSIQSPPIQVMEKTGGYDPHRIPDCVFGRSSSAAMEWSVASNESLFSLHLGNNSFSREQFLMTSGELYNSGELCKPDETAKSGRPPLIPVGKVQKEEAMDSDKNPDQTKAADETMEDSSELDIYDELEEKETVVEVNGHSSMISRPSDASGTSTQSFAFPILVESTKSDSVKGASPRQRDMKAVVDMDSPKGEAGKKSSSRCWGCCCCYSCCSLPQCSCPSYQHCWSWKWCNKWFCC
ncbi:suppressor protein SRP40 [Heracleum sosnowskyi]|uniref:Suppressor protein SRP40 n=1 Tax=Heracleum sosnowskyi TaxID=360622 RepID=A0AAD8IRR7_9APIA|nr:suppressor protein SRP40 [Heracleum sosnowskyi]